MIRALKRLYGLPGCERKLLLQAIPELTRAVIRLKLFGFRNCYDQTGRPRTASAPSMTGDELEAVGLAIRRASNGLKIGTCLSRSLALRGYLHRRGVYTSLRIGVDKQEGELKAHAWLEYQGAAIGETVPGNYIVLPQLR